MRLIYPLLALALMAAPVFAQTSKQLKEAYTYAFQLGKPINEQDFKLALQFEESVMEWNRATTQLVFDLADDSVTGEQWLERFGPRMIRVRAAIAKGTQIVSQVREPAVRELLNEIHVNNLIMLVGYDSVAEGIRTGNEAIYNYGIERIKAGGAGKRAAAIPFIKRLQEKLGTDVMEKSFERAVKGVLKELEEPKGR